MNKDEWIKDQVRNYGSAKSVAIFYAILFAIFALTAIAIT